VPVAGQPVLGSTLQEGGLELQLTLLNATTMQPLSGADNPRPQEGLFSGVAGRQFGPTARLTDKSSHTFECKVLLLSSDINDALVKIKVSRPGLAAADAADPLCVVTREFRSRARSNKSDKKDKGKFRSLSTGDDDEGATFRGGLSAGDDDGGVVFRSTLNEDEGEDEGESEEEEEEDDDHDDDHDDDRDEPAVLARTDSNQARSVDQLQRLLSGLESQQPMPSGPALLEALRMCRIGS
jgi:hypothetical protein